MKIGLIATGRIAETQLAPAINAAAGAELWSVYSRDRQRASDFANRHGAASATPGYGDLDEMLADDALDAAHLKYLSLSRDCATEARAHAHSR